MNTPTARTKPAARSAARQICGAILWILLSPADCCGTWQADDSTSDVTCAVHLDDGTQLTGQLTRFDRDGLTISADGETTKIDLQRVEKISIAEPTVAFSPLAVGVVTFVDGTMVPIVRGELRNGIFHLQMNDGQRMEIDKPLVQHVRFRTSQDNEDLAAQWNAILQEPIRTGDRLVVRRDDRLSSFEGIVRSVNAKTVEFEYDDRVLKVRRDRVEGISVFQGRPLESPKLVGVVSTLDGARLSAEQIALEQNRLNVNCPVGIQLQLPIEQVAELDFTTIRYQFLTDLTPTSRKWTPLIESQPLSDYRRQMNLPRTNESFQSRPLTIQFEEPFEYGTRRTTRQFDKGLALRGGSKIAYSLNGRYARLTGWLGFAPDANENGRVDVEIRGDDRVLLAEQLENSGMETPPKLPMRLALDVTGVDRLLIAVDYADRLSVGDTIHMCELRLAR